MAADTFDKLDTGLDIGLLLSFLLSFLRRPGAGSTRTQAVSEFFTQNSSKIKQQTPFLFGMGYSDEAIFGNVLATFTPEEVAVFTAVNAELRWWERKFLRLVIGNMKLPELPPTESEVDNVDPTTHKVAGKTRTKTPTIVAGSDKDPRKAFVKLIIEFYNKQKGGAKRKAEATARMLRTNQLVVEDPLHQKALRVWVAVCDMFEEYMPRALGVASLADVTPALVIAKIKAVVPDEVDTEAPRPHDTAGPLKRLGRVVTPGAFNNAPSAPFTRTQKRLFAIAAVLVVIVLGTAAFAVTLKRLVPSEETRLINAYTYPAETPASAPVK